jgi:hypothetical protein
MEGRALIAALVVLPPAFSVTAAAFVACRSEPDTPALGEGQRTVQHRSKANSGDGDRWRFDRRHFDARKPRREIDRRHGKRRDCFDR